MSYPLIKYQLNKQLKIKPFFLGGTIIQRPEKSIVFGESSVVDKYYMAIVQGIMPNEPFTIESYIGRDPNDRKKMTSQAPLHPKLALTHGVVEKYIDGKYTLLKLKIITGRTHQIRVHMSSIGYPIIGDNVYANDAINTEVLDKYGLTRQALHACEIGIELYGKKHIFKAPLKPDMQKIIEQTESI